MQRQLADSRFCGGRRAEDLVEMFKPGDQVPASGVYRASHAKHMGAHYITALFGETFPTCLGCSKHVRFELALSAVYIYAHPQFNR